jgi:hypothetical protein
MRKYASGFAVTARASHTGWLAAIVAVGEVAGEAVEVAGEVEAVAVGVARGAASLRHPMVG